MRQFAAFVWASVVAVVLAACGGGGGGGDGGGGGGAPLSFSPTSVTATYAANSSVPITLTATAKDPSQFANGVYIYIVDGAQLLLPGIELSAASERSMRATLHTSPYVPAGRYQGFFQVQLCRDANCTSQLPGSPMQLPYDLTVTGVGGGGNTGGQALWFAPSVVAANVTSGESATVTVRANVTDAALFAGNATLRVVDPGQVLTSSVQQTPIDATTRSLTLHTAPTLNPGRFQGNLQVQLCTDASCAAQVAGSPFTLPYDITVGKSALQASVHGATSLSVHRGAALATKVPVSVTGSGLEWTGMTTADWLTALDAHGTGAGSFDVSFNTENLAVGSYEGSVVVATADQKITLPFTLTVLPTQFVLNSGVPVFTAVNGAPIAAQSLGFELDNGVASAWSATSSAAWLKATPLSGTTPATVTVQPDPTQGSLASGSYTADLVLSSPGYPSKTVTTQLTLSKAVLSAPQASLTLGGATGRDLSGKALSLSLGTGTNAWPYALSGMPAWLSSSTTSGTVDEAGTALQFTPNLATLTPGSASATVTVTATVNGDTVTLPLTLNINADQRRLLSSEAGVALTSSPAGTVLARTLTISDNFGAALAWSAASDAAWLSVTSGGVTGNGAGGNLVMTADASSLPDGAISYAKVTVSTSASGVSPVVVPVAVWKSTASRATIVTLPNDYSQLAADRLRPYVYAHNGGSSLDVLNAHTGQKIATIASVGSALGRMSVSPDGARLFALDTATRTLAVVNLATLAVEAPWPLVNAVNVSTDVIAIRPNGVEVVMVGDGTAYSAGRSIGQSNVYGPFAASADSRNVVTMGARYQLDQSSMSGGVLLASQAVGLDTRAGGNEQDVTISPNGTRAYLAAGGGIAGGGYQCSSMDATDGTFIGALPGGDAYPNNVEVTRDGRAICGIFGWYSTYDLWVHSANGAFLQGYKFAGYARALKARQMVVTPDGLVAVGLTDDPLIAFVAIGQ